MRTAIARPDTLTNAAATARDEIGRAVAFKIREAKSAEKLSTIAEDVLPEIEKFLESPHEKRLRRVRAGTTVAAVGAGAAIAFIFVASLVDKGLFILAAMGLVCFFIGLSFIINGLLFTVPKKILFDRSDDAERQRAFDAAPTGELFAQIEPPALFPSVTEHTTKHLEKKQPLPRE